MHGVCSHRLWPGAVPTQPFLVSGILEKALVLERVWAAALVGRYLACLGDYSGPQRAQKHTAILSVGLSSQPFQSGAEALSFWPPLGPAVAAGG